MKSQVVSFGSRARVAALICLVVLIGRAAPAYAAEAAGQAKTAAPDMSDGDMAHMSGHMYMTATRPMQGGDRQKADALVENARVAMAPYHDYHKAISDGYQIFLPNVPQSQYHFTKYEYGREARSHFDPHKPTSLLYTKTADGGYRLVGAMYTDRVDATEEELNERIPLSIARWHQHINFCKAPAGQKAAYFMDHSAMPGMKMP
jgi:hypothetical protein